MISFLVKKVQSCGERCWLGPDSTRGPPFLLHHPILISADAARRNPCARTPRTEGCCPHSSGQESKADKPTEGPAHHSYLILFQLLMSEDGLLVAHGEGHCQEQAPEAPSLLSATQLPGCHTPVSEKNLPALAVTRPPAPSPPAWGRLKLQPSSLDNSLSMSMATRARRRAVGGHRTSDHTCHHRVSLRAGDAFQRQAAWWGGAGGEGGCKQTPTQIPVLQPLAVQHQASHLTSLSLIL